MPMVISPGSMRVSRTAERAQPAGQRAGGPLSLRPVADDDHLHLSRARGGRGHTPALHG
eukprot:CAMPEP_0206026166 /NCGR_PEP_ID=MMETSP1464-20131121/41253_1 /ASSEMBLY_ACC=CAM_ASM_001124 /TAXON_ID=119497 /ORGANISM="Exanthemachrysis gayraliae, Strain RCC1523" /LENGTH=58 /DNA_ID=CAMNT_0053400207 /DNA_START=226 /DNA_END=398 /DNA_ORIENTATION=-